jgi:predicted nucleic acid-binding protein
VAAVVVDTNVFAADLRPGRWPLADAYAELIGGRGILLSFVTVAEVNYGAR